MTLHLVAKKGNRIPPVTNQSQQDGSSLCVDEYRPTRSSSLFRDKVFDLWSCRGPSGQNPTRHFANLLEDETGASQLAIEIKREVRFQFDH